MNRKGVLLILVAIGIVATLRPTTNTTAAAVNFKSGAVYVLTNQVSNAVAVFDRAPDGTLTAAGTFSTGGAGNPIAQPGDPPTDPLLTNSGRYVYTTNTGSGVVSSYTLDANGTLTLLNSVAANLGATSFPIDMALNNSSRYLYVHAAGLQTVGAFSVAPDGSLTSIDSAGGLPFGAQGITAR